MTESMLRHNGGPALDEAFPEPENDSPLRLRVIRVHINDWVASTRGLTCEEEGFFWRFNLLLYDRMGVLADDDAMNARALSVDIRTFRRLKSRLVSLGKIQIEEGRLSHPRIVREIETYLAEYKRRSQAAKEREARRREEQDRPKIAPTLPGLLPEFSRKSAGSQPEVQAIFPVSPPELNGHKYEKTNEINGCTATTVTTTGPRASCARAFPKPKPKPLSVESPYSPPMGDGPLDEPFEEFWKVFPTGRKQGKGGAKDAFRKIITGRHRKGLRAKAVELIEGAKRYAASRPDPQYTPMPSTWLNEGRWEDDAASLPPPPPPEQTAVWDEFRRARELDEQVAE